MIFGFGFRRGVCRDFLLLIAFLASFSIHLFAEMSFVFPESSQTPVELLLRKPRSRSSTMARPHGRRF